MINYCLKYIFIAGLFFSINPLNAQKVNFDHGKIEFYTTTIMSDIDAITEQAVVKLDIETGEFEVIVNIKSFEFEYELMQEHFNEKYMESDKFPQAILKGKILQDLSNISEETEVKAAGNLTIHGVTKAINIAVSISKNEDFVVIKSKIPIAFKDYNIDEPSILTKSVAKNVEVKSTLYLK